MVADLGFFSLFPVTSRRVVSFNKVYVYEAPFCSCKISLCIMSNKRELNSDGKYARVENNLAKSESKGRLLKKMKNIIEVRH